jgi:hypothetical protein
LRGQVTYPAAEGESGHAGRADHAPRRNQTDGLRRRVEIEPGRAALGAGGPRIAVDVDPAHQREIDHEPAVTDAVSGGVVPASAHGHFQRLAPREVEGGRHIGGAEAAHDHRGPAVHEAVEAAARRVVPGIGGRDDGAGHRPPQLGEASASWCGGRDLFTHWNPFLSCRSAGGLHLRRAEWAELIVIGLGDLDRHRPCRAAFDQPEGAPDSTTTSTSSETFSAPNSPE